MVAWPDLCNEPDDQVKYFGQLRLDRGYTDAAAGGARTPPTNATVAEVWPGLARWNDFVAYWCGAGPRPSTRSTAARFGRLRHGVRAAGGVRRTRAWSLRAGYEAADRALGAWLQPHLDALAAAEPVPAPTNASALATASSGRRHLVTVGQRVTRPVAQ